MPATIHDSQEPLRDEDLIVVERELGIRLPEDYRNFMLRHNGGRPDPGGFDITWPKGQLAGDDWKTSAMGWLFFIWDKRSANLLRMNQVTFAGRIPRDTVAIGHDAGGNPILLALDGPYQGKVLFWCADYEVEEGKVPSYENVGIVADSFEDFINNKLR
jgi:hypothetical protein